MGLFKKKEKGESEDANRNALFGDRKGKAAPQAANPYAAQPAAQDPYAAQGPPPYGGGGGRNDSYRQDKTPSVTSQGARYGGGSGGYGGQGGGYGESGGYGGDRYGGGGGGGQQPPRRQGGYGGLGSEPSEEDRGALFGGAANRQQQRMQQPPQQGGYGGQQQSESGGYGGQSGAYGGGYGSSGGYGSGPSYDSRNLTAEEQEEEDVAATKNEIKFMKQQDVSSTRNALRLAQQAEETGRDTLARLGAQGERIHNTERNLDLAASQNRLAEEKARELKTLNRSMFAVHVGNPFTSSSRREERDRKMLETHQNERAQRDATRKAAWESGARNENAMRDTGGSGGPGRSTLADRAKYQFEADSDDDAMENEIDDNLNQLHGAAKRLNQLGRAMNTEVDTQNQHIGRIITKTDKVDDQIAMNRARLDRIH